MAKHNFKAGMVVRYHDTHPYFSWQNGLYVVVRAERGGKLYLSELRYAGLHLTSDMYDYCTTNGVDNPHLTATRLTYQLERKYIPKP